MSRRSPYPSEKAMDITVLAFIALVLLLLYAWATR